MSEYKVVLTCPLGSTCRKVVTNERTGEQEEHVCRWLFRMSGENPATGEKVDKSDCAIAWLPMMLHENTKQQLQTTAAVDDLKNSMAEATEASTNLLITMASAKPGLITYNN